MKKKILMISILLSSISFVQAQTYYKRDNIETDLNTFNTVNGQWQATMPANNTLGANYYQGLNFGYDANNYASLVSAVGTNELYFGTWSWSWKGWNKIWHSGNLNRSDADFTAQNINTTNLYVNGNVGIGTTSPLSNLNNKGLHIDRGDHSMLLLGAPNSSSYGGVIQTSDRKHRIFIGANLYDDPTLGWKNFQSGKGSAGISVLADYGGWDTGIEFYTANNDNELSTRMLINGKGNVGTTSPPKNSL